MSDYKIYTSKFKEKSVSFKLYLIETIKTRRLPNSVDLDEVAHYEPPHLDLRCLQFSFSV